MLEIAGAEWWDCLTFLNLLASEEQCDLCEAASVHSPDECSYHSTTYALEAGDL